MRAINTVTTHSLHRRGSLRLRPSSSLSSEFEFEWRATGHRAQWSHSRHPQRQRPQSGFIPPPGRVPGTGTRARAPFPTERPPLIEPLGLTGPVLALCVGCAEVDRGACELRYALRRPFSGVASQGVGIWGVEIARVFFWPCRSVVCSGNAGRSSRTGQTCEPLLGAKSRPGSTLLRSAPSNKCTNGMDGFYGCKFLRPSSTAEGCGIERLFQSCSAERSPCTAGALGARHYFRCQSLVYDAASPAPLVCELIAAHSVER
jgi:hypothetical protein